MVRRKGKKTQPLLSPEQLMRVLELEEARSFDNRAVAGGTDRALLAWLVPAAEKSRSLRSRQRLSEIVAALTKYRAIEKEARAAVVGAVRAELVRLIQPDEPISPAAPVSVLPGIGPARALALSAEGVHTVEDLLLTVPRSYVDTSQVVPVAQLTEGERAGVTVTIVKGPQLFRGPRVSRVEAVGEDHSGRLLLVFFNQPWQAERLAVGVCLTAIGRVRRMRDRIALVVEKLSDPAPSSGGRIVPEYRLAHVPDKVVRRAIAHALNACASQIKPLSPPQVSRGAGVLARPESVRAIHAPQSLHEAEAGRRGLVFDHLLALQVRLLRHRRRVRQPSPEAVISVRGLAERIEQLAGFTLTRAQRRVISEVERDLADQLPAYRLIHGDVGCGKTVVVAAALLAAAQAGAQAAMMAPTEVLAEQHAVRLSAILSPAGVKVHLLTGSLSRAHRRPAEQAAARGEPGVWVGTHALIQEAVEFKRLAVAVVDEQHRFGVAQRAALAQKGFRPNFFAVSATPIPRTLALALYADFDISSIDELPPGRKPVKTVLVSPRRRKEAYALVRERVEAGQQAFVICPLIEASQVVDAEAAVEKFEELRAGPLSGLRLGLVHGRMATADRQATMQAFYDKCLDVLVSTTVIEVGVDVPNASVMVIESSERFGLAQLHQLRGRVARSRHNPVCVLVSGTGNKEALQRLHILVQSSDGLAIAQADLEMRGAGELAGLRQHGAADWLVGDILQYPDLLSTAAEAAREIVEQDPRLTSPVHRGLREAVEVLGDIETGRWAL